MIEVLDEIAIRTGKTRSSVIRETLIQMMGAYLGEDDQSEQPHESSGDEELEFIKPIR
jgi:metal-responsive CopG/Arc/MetJ family transcriptional regulator